MTRLEVLLKRRSIRRFKKKQVQREIVDKLVKAGQRAPTQSGIQSYSFILITDLEIRERILKTIEPQECMKQAPIWIIICIDFARPLELFKMLGVEAEFGEVTKLFTGIIDACLAAENIVIAAESLGLGSVFIGRIWLALKSIAEIINLPKDVLPILLLCIGYPDESPPLRPRWPIGAVLHENLYNMTSNQVMRKYYEEANETLIKMKYFKRFRKEISSWAEHWQSKFKELANKWEESFKRDLRSLGFLPS